MLALANQLPVESEPLAACEEENRGFPKAVDPNRPSASLRVEVGSGPSPDWKTSTFATGFPCRSITRPVTVRNGAERIGGKTLGVSPIVIQSERIGSLPVCSNDQPIRRADEEVVRGLKAAVSRRQERASSQIDRIRPRPTYRRHSTRSRPLDRRRALACDPRSDPQGGPSA